MKPKIALNMWPFSSTQAGGTYYYAASILNELSNMCPERLVVLYGRHGKKLLEKNPGFNKVPSIELTGIDRIFACRPKFDVLFTPGAWRWFNMTDHACVNFIPDIQEYYYPQFFSKLELCDRHYYRPYAALSSTLVITISEYSKQTLIEKLHVPENRLRIIHPGPEPIFREPSDRGSKPAQMSEDQTGYLFYPANSWKHKNHRNLLEALSILKDRRKMTIPCVLSGHLLSGQFNHFDIPSEIKRLGLEGIVHHVGRVSLAELKYLYCNAAALILPSLFEGFGIPIVEAMSCGCPIIATNRTSIPEIAREAAWYFEPDNPEDIADKIVHFLASPYENRARAEIGKVLAENFSYQRQAEAHLAVLDEAFALAGGTNPGPRVASLCQQSGRPWLALIFQLHSRFDDVFAQKIAGIADEFGKAIEIVFIGDHLSDHSHAREMAMQWGITFANRNNRSPILKYVEKIHAPLVFIADGNSIIEKAFIRRVICGEAGVDTEAELFHGDSYYTDKTYSRTWSDIMPSGTENEERRGYCLSNYCMILTRDALLRVLRTSSRPILSIGDAASEAWKECSKQRIYLVVGTRKINGPVRIDYALLTFLCRFKRYYERRTVIGRFIRLPGFEWILLMVASLYLRMPNDLQLRVQGLYKIVAERLKG